ncbi:MAG: hypothetical protein ABSB58_01340 [Gemmatimonadales bacterium]
MPQREPLSAPLLGALFVVAGAASGWLLFALEALVQGGAGAAVGFPWLGVALTPPFGLPAVRQGLEGLHGPGSWAVFLLSGPLVGLAAGGAAHVLAEALAAPGWLRALAFEAFAFAWLRLPLLVLAAGLRRGGGPLAALYDRLGEPESGRWAALGLGAIILWGVSALVAQRAVALGRDWLRVDGVEFRRRLVRVVAGYPFVAATAAFALVQPLGSVVWVAVGLLLVMVCLAIRTP